ncbi:MAG: hypothetical protein Kow0099_37690 [Candidatus Abyssubacteria bacterium]
MESRKRKRGSSSRSAVRSGLEEELRLAQERYLRILDTYHDIVLVIDSDARIRFANKAWHDNVSYTLEQINRIDLFDTIHADDRVMAREAFRKILSGESIHNNIEYRGITIHGETKWFEASGYPIDWPDADRALLLVVRDITERKHMEEEIRISEERLRLILTASSDGITVVSHNGRMLYANRNYFEDTGYTLEETNRIGFLEIVHPADRAEALARFREMLEGKPVHNFVCRVISKSGEIKWMESNSDLIRWPGADKAVVTVTRDITDRIRTEDALRVYHRFLEIANTHAERKPLLDDFVDEIAVFTGCRAVGIRILDEGGNIPYCASRGFPTEFLEVEGPLSVHSHSCMCINVINGNLTPNLPFTDAGSFLTGSTTALLSSLSKGQRAGVRAACNRFGYESVALIPIRVGERILGLIHVADPTPQKISLETVTVLDKAALQLGAALARLETKQALRESEERYRNIFWEAPDIFFILDLDTWIVTDANKFALETLEYGPEFLGKIHVTDIIHPDDMDAATGRLREMIIQKDRMPDFPLRILTRSGKVRHIEQSGVIFWDEEGHAKSFLGLAHDVTDRKMHEETIRKQNEELAALYEVAKAANESLDINALAGVMLDIIPRITNSMSMAILTFESDQTFHHLAQRGLSEKFVKETDNVRFDEGLLGLMYKTRQPLLINNLLSHPALSRKSAVKELGDDSVIMAPLLVKGEILGAMVVSRKSGNPYNENDLNIVQAIANQIAVAMANARLYSEILEREGKLHSILSTSRDGVFVTSENRRVIYRNRALNQMFGYGEDDDLSEIDTRHYFTPESYEVLEKIRERLDRKEMPDEIITFKARRKDGSAFDAELRLGFFTENGQRFDVGVIRDVTERNRMEFQLHQSSKLATIGELAAGVAHEINNPIANISVQTGLIREIVEDDRDTIDPALFQRLVKYLELVERQAERCNSITNDLLSFSRMPRGADESFDVNKLIKKTVKLMTQLTDKNPRIELNLASGLPYATGDPNRLEQVFVNLLSNALKAIEPGGVISIDTEPDGEGSLKIRFKDSGAGIPPEIRDRIFDPFFTTSPEGTGLGLSISYYNVSQMNGKLEVDSDPGNGTTFTITLKNGPAE